MFLLTVVPRYVSTMTAAALKAATSEAAGVKASGVRATPEARLAPSGIRTHHAPMIEAAKGARVDAAHPRIR